MMHHTSGNARPKIYGPFWPYNKRGLPIVMKNGIPAWMAVAETRAALTERPND
jgi:hypothetical protein